MRPLNEGEGNVIPGHPTTVTPANQPTYQPSHLDPRNPAAYYPVSSTDQLTPSAPPPPSCDDPPDYNSLFPDKK